MFSLVIAIIAIALVVALLLAGGFYGGSAVSTANARSEAARLKNEEQQILAAVEMFRADKAQWPQDVDELLQAGYLRSKPKGVVAAVERITLMSSAFASEDASEGWAAVESGQPVFTSVAKVPKLICAQYNLASRGDDGILKHAYASLPAQCYGVDGAYQVVFFKTGPNVKPLADMLQGSLVGGLPAASGGAVWWDELPTGPVKAPIDPEKVPVPALALIAPLLDFGSTYIDSYAGAATLTLKNTGNGELTNLVPAAAPEGFEVQGSTCSSVLAPDSTCTMVVRFKPTAPRAYSGEISFASNAAPVAVQLKGQGTKAGLVLSQGSIEFVDTHVGAQAPATTVTLTNTGNGELTNLAADAAPEGFDVQGSTCGAALAPNASCTMDVGFKPTAARVYSGAMNFASNAAPVSLQLQGQGTKGELALSQPAITFADTTVGAGSAATTLTLTNLGNGELSGLTTSAVPLGFVVNSSTCSASLAPAASCTISLGFAPTEMRSYAGSLTFGSNDGSATLQLAGLGTKLELTADRALVLNIGRGPALAKHYARYTFSNTGNVNVTLGALTQTAGAGFVSASTCTSGKVLAPAAQCQLDIGFRADMERSASLSVSARLVTSAGDKAMTVTGSSEQLEWAVVSGPGQWVVGQTYNYLFRLTNKAPTTFAFGSGTSSDGKFELVNEVGGWTYTGTNCGATLAPGAACDVSLTVKPWKTYTEIRAPFYARGALRELVNGQEGAYAGQGRYQGNVMNGVAIPVNYGYLTARNVNPAVEIAPHSAWWTASSRKSG